jgi:hypothetical protein
MLSPSLCWSLRQAPTSLPGRRPWTFAIFDEIGPHRRLLDHVGEIALVHLGHAAARMTRRQIFAEEPILLLGRPRLAGRDLEIGMTAKELALGWRWPRTRRRARAPKCRRNSRCSSADRRTDWLRRKPIRPSASFNSLACRPESSVKTFRSTLPGRYGHGDGFVTKNLGKAKWCAHPRGLQWLRNSLCDW